MTRAWGRLLDAAILTGAVGMTALAEWSAFGRRPGDGGTQEIQGWEMFYRTGKRLGSPESPYQMVVWTDYQCPACKRLEGEISTLMRLLGDSLSVVYHDFPLTSIHPAAQMAAIASRCADRQHRFGEMHKLLFGTQLRSTREQWHELAREAGVGDSTAFDACLDSPEVAGAVRQDIVGATALELGGTPGILIGDRVQVGGQPAEELMEKLKDARALTAKISDGA